MSSTVLAPLAIASALACLTLLLTRGRDRLRTARLEGDSGASAIELAIIAAVLAAAAVLVGGVIYTQVTKNSDNIGKTVTPGT